MEQVKYVYEIKQLSFGHLVLDVAGILASYIIVPFYDPNFPIDKKQPVPNVFLTLVSLCTCPVFYQRTRRTRIKSNQTQEGKKEMSKTILSL